MTEDTNDNITPDDMVADAGPDAEIAAKDAEIAELKDRLLRAAAETENTRRRLERDKQDATAYAMTAFARDLLAVADNLRRALEHLPESAREDEAIKQVATGVEMTERELGNVLTRHGVTRIESIGQRLDPNRHQAMIEIEHEAEPGTIVQEMQAGYTIKDRLLRPSLVGVAKPKG